MNLKKLIKLPLVAASSLLFTAMANAGSVNANDDFYGFWSTVDGWTKGGLGVGLATTMLLMGGAIGVAKNSPMPALTGVAGAAFLHWGPTIIQTMILGQGSLI